MKRRLARPLPVVVLPFVVGVFFVGLPFVLSRTGFDNFRVPKDVFSALFIVIIGAIYLVSRKLEVRFRPRTWEFFLGVAILYVGVHSLLSKRPDVSLSGFFQIVYFSALLLVVIEVATQELQKKIWLWVAGASAVNAVVTVLQYFGRFPLMTRPSGEVLEGRLNPAGFIGDVNSGGFLFALVCLMLLYGMLVEKRPWIRLVSVILFFLNLTGLVFTRTLSAIVALGVCLGIWLLLHHWWVFRTGKRLNRDLLFLWLVLILGTGGMVALVVGSGLQERIKVVWSQMQRGDWTQVTAGRQPIYLITWDMIKDQPWRGYGLNTFGQDFFFYRAGTVVGQSVDLVNQPGSFRETHNEYLQVWEELGLVGLLFFVVLLFWPAFRAVPRLRRLRDPEESYWIGIIAIGTLFVAINCLAFFPFHVSLTSAYIVLLIGGLRHFENEERVPVDEKLPNVVLKSFVLVLVAVWLAYPQFQKWRANSEMAFATFLLERVNSGNHTPLQRVVFAKAALVKLENAERLYPRFYEIHNLRGSASMVLGRHAEAVRHYGRAAGYLPSPELLTNLAAGYLALERFDVARSLLETALRYNPGYPRARQALEYLEARNR